MVENEKQKIITVNRKLRVILKSDLCVGSGFSYAGIIDSDVSYNKNGIPFISGRRLKGCMKEAAELIGVENISEIFGTKGENSVKGIYISNAFPKNTEFIKSILSELQEKKCTYASYLNQQNILKQFTSVKAQTKIGEEGIAKENTLRFTRIINQYDSINNTDMIFEAELLYEYAGEKDPIDENLKKIVKATRNIGLNRNRGLGSIKMELLNENEGNMKITIKDESKGEGKKKISYRIKNIQPLLISNGQNDVTESYINGTSVLGAFAGEYLKNGDADSKEFREIFLEGRTIFSNLMLTEKIEENWITTHPAPLYINRLKKTKKLVNIAVDSPYSSHVDVNEEKAEKNFDFEYSTENGNQPKKLKTQFLLYHNGKYDIKEVKKEIIYHHTKKEKSKNGEDGILYFLEAIEENQYFSGEIIVESDHLEIIKKLLERIRMRFGKSKSAQYGLCRIEPDSVVITDYKPVKTKGLKAGMKVLVTLISDGIFVNEEGIYTIEHDEVRKQIAKQLNLDDTIEDKKSFIQTKVLTGFYTKWNLNKQQIPIIQAGSAFEYTLKEDLIEYKEYIGEKNLEGFGKCYIVGLTGAEYRLKKIECRIEKENLLLKELFLKNGQETYFGKLFLKILLEEFVMHIKQNVFKNEKINITSSALGRLGLMMTEVENEIDSAMDRYISLRKRIDSIKSKDTQKEIMRFLSDVLGKDVFTKEEKEKFENMKKDIWQDKEKQEEQKKIIVNKLKEKKNGMGNIEEYDILMQFFDENLVNISIFELWSQYFKDVLIYQKYLKKGEDA